MVKILRALLAGGLLTAAVAQGVAVQGVAAQSDGHFQATFENLYSQCAIHPPTLVFCGNGTVAGYGKAYSTAWLTGPLVPLGNGCFALHADRLITMDDNSGSLLLVETGTKCQRSDDASATGNPYIVAKTYTVGNGTGIFAGASGSGSDVNRSAGNEQVSDLQGSLNLS